MPPPSAPLEVLELCLEHGHLTLDNIGRICASSRAFRDHVKGLLCAGDRQAARKLVLRTTSDLGMDAKGYGAADTANGIAWLIATAGVTHQMLQEDSLLLLSVPRVHRTLIQVIYIFAIGEQQECWVIFKPFCKASTHDASLQVLLAAGVSVTLDKLTAAARDQVEGVQHWVVELCRDGGSSGLPAAVEAICCSEPWKLLQVSSSCLTTTLAGERLAGGALTACCTMCLS